MHTDEAVQAVKLGDLLETGRYRYDPREYHGPTLYYLAAAWFRLLGIRQLERMDEIRLRLLPSFFGIALIAMTALWRPGLRRSGLLAAGMAVALNPFLVFYSRYFVQEMLLVAFTAATLGAIWRYVRWPSRGAAIAAGLGAGAMFATKETAVLTWAAAAIAGAVVLRMPLAENLRSMGRRRIVGDALASVASAAAVAVCFFSSWFTNWPGVRDAFAAFGHFAKRAGGQGHEKPFDYYLHLLFLWKAGPLGYWSQWPLLLAALPAAAAAVRRTNADPGARFFLLFSLALLAIYSLIPYKTPWLMATPIWGFCMLAGFGVQTVWNTTVFGRRWLRWVALLLLAAGAADAHRQNRWMAGRYRADPINPCVYSHTSTDLLNGVRLIDEAAGVAPAGRNEMIAVVAGEYWPLPWYLRAYPRVGYWSAVPDGLAPPAIVATNPSLAPDVERWIGSNYVPTLVGLRPTVGLMIYLRRDLWDAVLAHRGAALSP